MTNYNKSVLIELEQLSKSYQEGGQTRTVLNELNCEFYTGEFVCLLGRSGSGKSTLINLISGIDAPSHGNVRIHNPDGSNSESTTSITTLNEHQRTLFRRQNIGIVFQFFNLIPTLTVLENVTLPLELAQSIATAKHSINSGKSKSMSQGTIYERGQHLLEKVGLGDRLDTYPDKLSGGEQQRVAIARALVHDPLLILADEPTGNLDENTGKKILRLLLGLTRDSGKTLFMATHAPDIAKQADRVIYLEHGKLISDETGRHVK